MTGARERLKERDMKWLVTMLLEEYGFPADYPTHLICECDCNASRCGRQGALRTQRRPHSRLLHVDGRPAGALLAGIEGRQLQRESNRWNHGTIFFTTRTPASPDKSARIGAPRARGTRREET